MRILFETLRFPGFWKLARKYYRDGMMEMARFVSKRAFVKSLQQLIPEVTENDLVPTQSGVRAQALMPDGKSDALLPIKFPRSRWLRGELLQLWQIQRAPKTKPFGFMPFYLGPGLGGHCIPIDPFYLTSKAREYGQHTRFIELAGEINTRMPEHVVHTVADALNAQCKAIKGSRILILGLAYKPNVDDERESPSYVLMKLLAERGAEVAYYDPYVPVIKATREHPQFPGRKSVEWNRATIEAFDVVLIATDH